MPRHGTAGRRLTWRMLLAPFLLAAPPLLLAQSASDLTAAEISRLAQFQAPWGAVDVPREYLDDERRRDLDRAIAAAREAFAGREVAIARHFLLHTDYKVPNDAYWFVLFATADEEAALELVRALPDPPEVRAGVMARYYGEIAIALEGMLKDPAIAGSEAVTAELIRIIDARRGSGEPAEAAIPLLGLARTDGARAALQRLTRDPSAQARELAVRALGAAAVGSAAGGDPASYTLPPIAESSTLGVLIRVLESDPSEDTRARAAEALAKTGGPEAVAALDAALDRDSSPRVVDAIVTALEGLDAPPTDPDRCREIVRRGWEPSAQQACFERWRVTVGPDQLTAAALEGPGVQRILAIETMVAATNDPARRLMKGQSVPLGPIAEELRPRLLASLAEVLSAPPNEISSTIVYLAQRALSDIAGADMALALEHADAIAPVSARLATSVHLARQDFPAYAAVRRPTQATVFIAVAAIGVLVAIWPRARRAGMPIAASGLALAAATFVATSARTLPPPPLWLLTAPAIGVLTAGAVAALCGLRRADRASSALAGLGLSAVQLVLATVGAIVICGWTRSADLFPAGPGGWELLFEPIASGILAGVWSLLLVLADYGLRRTRRTAPTAVL